MAEAFATPAQLAAQWRTLTAAESEAAASHFDTVASLIRTEFRERAGLDDVPDDLPSSKSGHVCRDGGETCCVP